MKAKMKPARAGVQTPRSFSRKVTIGYRYLLYRPAGSGRSTRRWPLILFLHGAGERGDDLDVVKKHGPPKLAGSRRNFPFIVVSPQCPAGTWWSTQALQALLDHVTATLPVDPSLDWAAPLGDNMMMGPFPVDGSGKSTFVNTLRLFREGVGTLTVSGADATGRGE